VFSADGTLLLTASKDGTAKIWNGLTGSLMGSLEGHRDALLSGVFSGDGKQVLTFGEDNRAIIWDWQKALRPGRTTAKIGGRNAVFSAEGDRVIAGDGKQLSSWVIGPGSSPSPIALPQGVEAVTVTPNGARVIGREGSVLKLFDVKTCQRVGDLLVKEPAIVAFSQNSKYVVIASHGDNNILTSMRVEVWETESGRLKAAEPPLEGTSVIGPPGDVRTGVTVAVNSSGTRVFGYTEYRRDTWISPSDNWESPFYVTNETQEHKGTVTLAAFTPDDKYLLTASDDKTIKIWREGKDRLRLVRTLIGHTGNITSIKFSDDNQRIATTSADGSAKVWDLATGTLIASCEGHRGRVNAAEFSRDHERLVTIGDDGTLRVWDSRTGDLLATIQAHTGAANAMSYSSKHDLVVTTGADGAVGVWDLSYTVLDPKELSARVARIISLQIANDQLIPTTVKGAQ
jgi:WD40 repeat protein